MLLAGSVDVDILEDFFRGIGGYVVYLVAGFKLARGRKANILVRDVEVAGSSDLCLGAGQFPVVYFVVCPYLSTEECSCQLNTDGHLQGQRISRTGREEGFCTS